MKTKKKLDPRMDIIIVPDEEERSHPTLGEANPGQVVYILKSDNQPHGYVLVLQDPNGHINHGMALVDHSDEEDDEIAVVTLDKGDLAIILLFTSDTPVRFVESRLVINE